MYIIITKITIVPYTCRCNMSVNNTCTYSSQSMARQFGPNWTRDLGCHYPPLFGIPLENVVTVIDEVHLMLHITDTL